jgi:putative addiction module CopG family antidote
MQTPPKSSNVPVAPELSRFIRSRVDSGRYQIARDVARAALRLPERDEAGLLRGTQPKQPEPVRGQEPDA